MSELVEKAKAGDVDAHDKLYRLHVRLVYAHVSRFISCEADIEDIVSDVFTNARSNIRRFEGRCSFATWLIRIADNRIKNFIREMSRWSDDPIQDVLLEEITEAETIKAIIREALHILTPKQREAVVLHTLEEYTFKEVANKLSTTEGAVKSRYYLSLGRLRKHLTKNPFIQEYLGGIPEHNEETKFQRTRRDRNSCQLFRGTQQGQETLHR